LQGRGLKLMGKYVLKRFLYLLPTLLGILTIIFFVMRLIPGDPVLIMLGPEATPEAIAKLRHELGYDRPIIMQYLIYLANVLHFNYGTSIATGRPVWNEILAVFPFTFTLALAAVFFGVLLGIPLGIIAATRRGTWVDVVTSLAALFGISMPNFWLGLLLILIFSLRLEWFPAIGAGEPYVITDLVKHLILPAVTLGLPMVAIVARIMRSSMLETLGENYIRTARGKGLPERVVIYTHALRNALLPTVTVVGLNMGWMLGGSVIVEKLFARPGVGSLLVDSIIGRDYPVVQGGVIFFAFLFMVNNLLVDILYAWLDPRIRLE